MGRFVPRAEAGPIAARPAGHHAAGRRNCCNSAWRRWRSWSQQPKDEEDRRGTAMTRIATGCWPWPTSCGGCSTTNCPACPDLRTQPVWAAGELLEFGGDFNKYITCKDLQKQEGMIFRHLLRLILLVGELKQLCPPDDGRRPVAGRLGGHCRAADRELPSGGSHEHGFCARAGGGRSCGGGRGRGRRIVGSCLETSACGWPR